MAIKPFYVRVSRDDKRDITAGVWRESTMETEVTQRDNGNVITVANIRQHNLSDKLYSSVECRTKSRSVDYSNHVEAIDRVEIVDSDGNVHNFDNAQFVRYEVKTNY